MRELSPDTSYYTSYDALPGRNSEPQPATRSAVSNSEGWFRFAQSFYKVVRVHFFDIHSSIRRYIKFTLIPEKHQYPVPGVVKILITQPLTFILFLFLFLRLRFQPALVRYDGFLLFTVGDPNKVLSSRFIQS